MRKLKKLYFSQKIVAFSFFLCIIDIRKNKRKDLLNELGRLIE